MARSCLFTLRLSLAAALNRNRNFQVIKCYSAHIHKHAISKQYEAPAEKRIPEAENFEHEATENQKEMDVEGLKIKILENSLNFVLEHGWTEKSLALGAKSAGVSVASHTLIEGGGPELVHYFNYSCNMELEDYLRKIPSTNAKIDLRDYLSDALEYRLRLIIPYLSKWPEAMALMASPAQIPMHTRNVMDLVDSVWHFYGDTSLDMSWYGKRITLAFVYKAAELSLIKDKSEDFSDTFEFLEKRVENVVDADNFSHTINENTKQLQEFGSGAFITARNLLGLNRWFR